MNVVALPEQPDGSGQLARLDEAGQRAVRRNVGKSFAGSKRAAMPTTGAESGMESSARTAARASALGAKRRRSKPFGITCIRAAAYPMATW
jgi:hypothetical protein